MENIRIAQHARMQNQIQIENERYIKTNTVNTTQMRHNNMILMYLSIVHITAWQCLRDSTCNVVRVDIKGPAN